jgi:transcriptional regulator with XRE-family HTH domain
MTDQDSRARGIRLKAARELVGLSQTDAAEKVGTSRVSISSWERGALPKEDNFERLADVYHVEVAWLRYGVGTPPPGLLRPLDTHESPRRRTEASHRKSA